MTQESSTSPFGQDGYTQKPPGRRGTTKYIILGVIFLVVLGIGTCSWAFVGMFKQAAERQTATAAFVATVLEDGLPTADSDIYHQDAGVTDEAWATVAKLMRTAGPPESIGETTCGVNSQIGTDRPNGTFATCATPIVYALTPGTITVTWKQQDDGWKLYHFHTGYDDISQLIDDKSNKADD